jgi:small-conductance mechanosensitive channel/CRP-like cAMP-binding protein
MNMNSFTPGLDGSWLDHWHLGLVASALAATVVQLLLTFKQPGAKQVLRHNILITLFCLLLGLLIHPLKMMGMQQAVSLLDELSTLFLGFLLIRICGVTAFQTLLPKLGLQPPAILKDILLVLTYIGWGLVRLRAAGLDLAGVVTTSAAITAVVAFSMQETLGNILGGLALQLDNSVRIGDWINVENIRGQVREVHWRHTDVMTTNGHLIVIPNSILMKSRVDVYSRINNEQFRRWIRFWIIDTVPPQNVINTVEKALREAKIAHVSHHPPVDCLVMDYREGRIEYAVRYWLTEPQQDDPTDSVVRVHLFSALRRQNFSLAHPVMNVSLGKDLHKLNGEELEQEMTRRKAALNRVNLFSVLDQDEINHVATSLRNTPFVTNDVITKQGAVAHWLYLLAEGEADVWVESNGRPTHLATLKEGDVFGEMGLLTGAPRVATITARTDAMCYRLDKELFAKILHDRPSLASEFAAILSERAKGLAALKVGAVPQQAEHATYLASIRRFFRLGV